MPDDRGVAGPTGGNNNMTDELQELRSELARLEFAQPYKQLNPASQAVINLWMGAFEHAHAVLVEMLTAATDTAMQRGKQLDAIRARLHDPDWESDGDGNDWRLWSDIDRIVDGADGG